MIKLIAAMTPERVIGDNGQIPWHLAGELNHFRRETLYQTVVMGRKTFESIGSKPLDKRRNYVLTRSGKLPISWGNLWFKASVEEIFVEANENPAMHYYVMGGENVYRDFLPYADEIVLTLVWRKDGVEVKGDTYFPKMHDMDWTVKRQSDVFEDGEWEYQITWYERAEVNS